MGRWIAVLLALGLLASGCGGGERERDGASPPRDAQAREVGATAPAEPKRAPKRAPKRVLKPAPKQVPKQAPAPATRCVAGTHRSWAKGGIAAVLLREATAHVRPGGRVVASFGLRNVNGVRSTFRVLGARVGGDCRPTWYRVQLPIRPNGSQGWIRAKAVRRYRVDYRIVVDLSARVVTVYKGDSELVRTPAAIGRPETPTPTGSFYVNQRLLAADASGAFGPGGIGISAFSPVHLDWAQGGPIAIHGTNRPDQIGLAASNGCVRIANGVLERLIHEVPDGTPVRIRA